MGLKFNPPPGWPLPYNFKPWPGWKPDPSWPPPPIGWPMWIGDGAPSVDLSDPRLSYQGRHSRRPAGAAPGGPPPVRRNVPSGHRAGPRRGRHQHSLARTTWVLLGTVMVAAIAVVAYRLGPGGTVARPEPVSFAALRPGACFQDPVGSQLARGDVVDVTIVSCTAAHNAQMLARFAVAGGRYPGLAALARQSAVACRAAVVAVRRSDPGRSVRVLTVLPGLQAWRHGFRAISCVAVAAARRLTTSLVRGHHAAGPHRAQSGARRRGTHRRAAVRASGRSPGGAPGQSRRSGRP